jgi:hypothetical protein
VREEAPGDVERLLALELLPGRHRARFVGTEVVAGGR